VKRSSKDFLFLGKNLKINEDNSTVENSSDNGDESGEEDEDLGSLKRSSCYPRDGKLKRAKQSKKKSKAVYKNLATHEEGKGKDEDEDEDDEDSPLPSPPPQESTQPRAPLQRPLRQSPRTAQQSIPSSSILNSHSALEVAFTDTDTDKVAAVTVVTAVTDVEDFVLLDDKDSFPNPEKLLSTFSAEYDDEDDKLSTWFKHVSKEIATIHSKSEANEILVTRESRTSVRAALVALQNSVDAMIEMFFTSSDEESVDY
jgi:hypothetical protein